MANEPITREEIMLNAIATGETANLKPITREEMFLAKLGGADVRTPTPITRKEQFLQKAIEGGSGGGGGTGGGDSAMLDALIDRSITEVSSNAESIGDYAFYSCKSLTTANFPFATSINQYAFHKCSALTTVNFPKVKTIGFTALEYCSALTNVKFPALTSIDGGAALADCTALKTADFSAITSFFGNDLMRNSSLTALIVRTPSVCVVRNVNLLLQTPIASGTGYIYVPRALIEQYKAATNWSTYAAQFRALEDYTVDGTTTGELDPSKI